MTETIKSFSHKKNFIKTIFHGLHFPNFLWLPDVSEKSFCLRGAKRIAQKLHLGDYGAVATAANLAKNL